MSKTQKAATPTSERQAFTNAWHDLFAAAIDARDKSQDVIDQLKALKSAMKDVEIAELREQLGSDYTTHPQQEQTR